MELLRVVFRHYRWPFVGVMLLSLLSAALGIGVIAFINHALIATEAGAGDSRVLTTLVPFIGLVALLAALLFMRWLPPSRHFTPRPFNARSVLSGFTVHFKDRGLPLLFLEAFLLMGGFVSLYNYIAYRLLAEPYQVSQALVGRIIHPGGEICRLQQTLLDSGHRVGGHTGARFVVTQMQRKVGVCPSQFRQLFTKGAYTGVPGKLDHHHASLW